MKVWIKSFLQDGPQGWVGTWMCLIFAIFSIVMAEFDVAKFYSFVTTSWAVFPALFGVSLSAQLWNRKNKMIYAPESYAIQVAKGDSTK